MIETMEYCEIAFTMQTGILTGNIAETSLRQYCHEHNYKLDLEVHKTLLQRIFFINIKLPYNEVEQAIKDIKRIMI